jgi:tetratricopeptide (TPR) repeat protein
MRPLAVGPLAALGVWLVSLALVRPAAADWEIRRDHAQARREQALRALRASPEDAGLAARVVRGLGVQQAARLLERVGKSAQGPSAPYPALLTFAQLLLAAGRAGEAEAAFARAGALQPQAVAPVLGRARALEREGHLARALEQYQSAATRERSAARQRPILQATAALAGRLGAAAVEIEARRLLLAERPREATRVVELAQALGRGGRPAEGAAAVEQLLATAGLTSARRLRLAREAASLREAAGEQEAAEKVLRAALESRSLSATERLDLYREVVRLALRRGRGVELEPWLARQTGPARQALAELREELGDYDGAVRAWRELHRGAPSNGVILRKLVALLDRQGRDEEVARLYEASMARASVDLETILEMIERRYRRGQRPDAQKRFDQALRRLRSSPRALVRLADLASRWNEGDRVLACWDALYALDPRDERAIVGLGEAHFQGGRRELARRTWHALLRVVKPPATAHARLAELLGDHDLLEESLPLARAAQKLEPAEPAHHRTLARILEKKRELSAAVSEWRAALQKSVGPERTHERREARSRIVNLLAREGRERLRAETVLLKDRVSRHPEDRESALFLAELQLRLQAPADAVQTLSAASETAPGDAELVLMLVRLLRQSRQTDRAVTWLERFADKVPARAPEALLQIAEIRLERYEDAAAMAAAGRAVELSRRAPEILLRAAELAERAGQLDQALASYRAALGEPASAKAALAAADLLVRRGQAGEALAALRAAGRSASDPETRADLMARELDIAEYVGELPDLLERLAAEPVASSAGERRLVVELYRRVLPDLYRRAARDGRAHARWLRLTAGASRPLIAALIDPDGEPEPTVIELSGMLGNQDVLPVLLRLIGQQGLGQDRLGDVRSGVEARAEAIEVPGTSAQTERVVVAALVAIGRLRGRPALPRLLELSSHPEARLRTGAVWALGRLGAVEAEARLREATRDPRAEVAALAALGLGRLRTPATGPLLRGMALDAGTPIEARRAALVGLAQSRTPDASGALLPLLDAPEPPLARTAAFTLGVLRDRTSLSPLWRRALLSTGQSQEVATLALAAFATEATVPDDAPFIRGGRLDPAQLLDDLGAIRGEIDAPLETLWIEYASEIGDLLEAALRGGAEVRSNALTALDSRSAGLGLGRLLATGTPLSSRGEQALAGIAERLRDPVVLLLEDPEAGVRLRALRLATKLHDARITSTHIVSALREAGGPGPEGLDPAQVALEALAGLRARSPRSPADDQRLWRDTRPLLAHPDWPVRLATVEALRISGPPPASLLQACLHDASPLVRAAARRALAAGPR